MNPTVDTDLARAFQATSPDDQGKLRLLLRLRLKELACQPVRSLQQIMDDMGREAAARGLTPEILQTLLHDQ